MMLLLLLGATNCQLMSRPVCCCCRYVWTSEAGSSFQVAPDTESDKMTRGTKIVLHLKKDQLEYLEEKRLKELVKKHSEFISFPINLQVTKETEKEVDADEETAETDADGKPKVEDATEEDGKKKTKKVKETTTEFERQSTQQETKRERRLRQKREWARKDYKANLGKYQERNKEQREKHYDRIRAKEIQYAADNREARAEACSNWYYANHERSLKKKAEPCRSIPSVILSATNARCSANNHYLTKFLTALSPSGLASRRR
jgi:hypothetical protein